MLDVIDWWNAKQLVALTRQRRAERPIISDVCVPTPRNDLRIRAWREREWAAGNRHCEYCGHPVFKQGRRVAFNDPHLATGDHRTPLGRQGADEEWNYAMACRRCNEAKGMMTEEEFRATLSGNLNGGRR